jgi:hypothetical protein
VTSQEISSHASAQKRSPGSARRAAEAVSDEMQGLQTRRGGEGSTGRVFLGSMRESTTPPSRGEDAAQDEWMIESEGDERSSLPIPHRRLRDRTAVYLAYILLTAILVVALLLLFPSMMTSVDLVVGFEVAVAVLLFWRVWRRSIPSSREGPRGNGLV